MLILRGAMVYDPLNMSWKYDLETTVCPAPVFRGLEPIAGRSLLIVSVVRHRPTPDGDEAGGAQDGQ